MNRIAINPVGVLASLGITSTILWCKLMGHTSGFFVPIAGLESWANARAFWLFGILICALVCCLLPKATRKMDAVQRYIIPCIAVAGAMSFALAFHQYFFDQRTLAVVGIVVSGFGYFWFISRFALLLAVTQGIPCLAWSFAAAFPLRHVLLIGMDAVIPVDWQVMVAIALPLASFAAFEGACVLARRRADEKGQETGRRDGACKERTLFGVPTLPKTPCKDAYERRYLALSVLALALMLSVVRACSISGMWGISHTASISVLEAVVSVAMTVVVVGVLVYLSVIKVYRYPVTMRFQVGILLVLAGLVVAAVAPMLSFVPDVLLEAVVSTNDPLALVLFWSAVCMAVVSLPWPANRVIGIAGVVYALASIVWVSVITKVNALDSALVLVAVYLFFAMFMLATWFVHQKRFAFAEAAPSCTPSSNASLASAKTARESDALSAEDAFSHALDSDGLQAAVEADASAVLVCALMTRCDELAEVYGLSPREKEVLVLLAQGKTGSAIQDELTLAASTVKTHMQHIYAKTGVGDRQQLMDMVLGKRE